MDGHQTAASLPRASDSQPDGSAWPRGLSSQEVSSYLTPPCGPDEMGRLGPYRVLKVLGVGGMGVVFLAEDPQLKRRLAVKAMKPVLAASAEARQRFLREAQAAAAVEHDNVISIYQVGEEKGVPFLAMPLLRGESLEDRLRRDGALPLPEVLRIGREIAEGLQAAHAGGLIHRDVKPSNVWLEEGRGRVKILDFGLARGKGDMQLTLPGSVLGTPAYMAPEQAGGKAVDHRCDIYSLGCVLYRMSSGEAPFQGADVRNVLKQVLLDTPRPLGERRPSLPPELSRLVTRLLAKDPSARPASAGSVADALRALETQAASSAPSAEVAVPAKPVPAAKSRPASLAAEDSSDEVLTVRARRPRRRSKSRGIPGWVWALCGGAAVLGMGLAIGLVLMNHGSTTPDRTPTEDQTRKDSQKDATIEPPAGWETFASKEGRFRVLLPGEPKASKSTSKTERGEIENFTFTIEVGKNTYAVAYFDFPGVLPEGKQIKAALEGGQQGLLKNLGTVKVLEDKEITLDGYPGKHVVVENAEKEYTLTARLYLVKQRHYTLMISTPLGKADAPEVRKFLDSFRLTR